MAKWVNITNMDCLRTGDIVEINSKIPGTHVVVPFVKHYGIILHICDVQYVTHIPWYDKPVMETREKFEYLRKIKRVMRPETPLTDSQIIGNYHNLSDKKYDFFNRNCEDYVSKLYNINIGFDQRRGYLIALLIIITLVLIFFNRKS